MSENRSRLELLTADDRHYAATYTTWRAEYLIDATAIEIRRAGTRIGSSQLGVALVLREAECRILTKWLRP